MESDFDHLNQINFIRQQHGLILASGKHISDIKNLSIFFKGGKPNPKRLQLITISSPKGSKKNQDDNEENIDEKDLKLILEDTMQEKPEQKTELETKKKRVPFVTLSS